MISKNKLTLYDPASPDPFRRLFGAARTPAVAVLAADARVTRRGKPKTLRAIHPNAGITAAYRAKMDALIREMQASYLYWLRAQYRETPPKMAQDAMPAKELERELKKLGIRWEEKFSEAAPRLARYFAKASSARTQAQLKQILKDGGFSVEFKMTPQLRDIMQATISENVSLIKSIASEYHTQVEGLVMRSVSAGRDLSYLTDELEARYGITRRRAELIALDQNNKATSAIRRERETSVGIQEGVWLHSHAGKEPRPTHVAQSGKKFSLSEGWYDPDPRVKKHIWPGELIRCRWHMARGRPGVLMIEFVALMAIPVGLATAAIAAILREEPETDDGWIFPTVDTILGEGRKKA